MCARCKTRGRAACSPLGDLITSSAFTLPTTEWHSSCSSTTAALRPSYSGLIVRWYSSAGGVAGPGVGRIGASGWWGYRASAMGVPSAQVGAGLRAGCRGGGWRRDKRSRSHVATAGACFPGRAALVPLCASAAETHCLSG